MQCNSGLTSLSCAKQLTIFSVLLLSLLNSIACEPNENGAMNAPQYFDIEGPRGLVNTNGPWLVRIALPEQIETNRLQLSYRIFANDQSIDREEPILSDEGIAEVIESARPDTAFALIPDIELGQFIEYTLILDGKQQSESVRFRKRVPSGEGELDLISPQCEVYLDSPDPKLPITPSRDQAPEDGVQIIFAARVFPVLDNRPDIESSEFLSGLMSFEWLNARSDRLVHKGVLATISGGLARSQPLTTPFGEQKLLITAYTSRSGRCQQVVQFSSN